MTIHTSPFPIPSGIPSRSDTIACAPWIVFLAFSKKLMDEVELVKNHTLGPKKMGDKALTSLAPKAKLAYSVDSFQWDDFIGIMYEACWSYTTVSTRTVWSVIPVDDQKACHLHHRQDWQIVMTHPPIYSMQPGEEIHTQWGVKTASWGFWLPPEWLGLPADPYPTGHRHIM